jgi:hypothetical protein
VRSRGHWASLGPACCCCCAAPLSRVRRVPVCPPPQWVTGVKLTTLPPEEIRALVKVGVGGGRSEEDVEEGDEKVAMG